MFNNYNELFDGCVEFYRNFLLDQDLDRRRASSDLDNECSVTSNRTTTLRSLKTCQSQELANLLDSTGSGQEHTILVGDFNRIHFIDIFYIIVIFLFLTLAKRLMALKLRQSNYVITLGLRQKDCDRLVETTWRLVYYSVSSSWLIYSCFFKHQSFLLFDPNVTFDEYSFDLDWDEYLACIVECAFYIHATYALIFEDVWRRDSPMMLVHHLAATFAFVSLLATRIHRIGLAAVILRDTCDVLLEITKLIMCFRIQRGKLIKSIELPLKFSFTIFTISFLVNQLYYYPLFCLYHFLNMTLIYGRYSRTTLSILICGLVFLILDLIWATFILRLFGRMILTSGSVDDLREYDAQDPLQVIMKAEKQLQGKAR